MTEDNRLARDANANANANANETENESANANENAPEAEHDDDGIAPRPRPGFRSRARAVEAFETASLVAGVVRASLGAAGLVASLLYLPIHTATPILAGVSILMMVTGSTSTWRSVRRAPASYRKIPLLVAGGCGLVTAATVLLTLVFGAGTFGPVAEARERAQEEARAAAREAPPTVGFQPAP